MGKEDAPGKNPCNNQENNLLSVKETGLCLF